MATPDAVVRAALALLHEQDDASAGAGARVARDREWDGRR